MLDLREMAAQFAPEVADSRAAFAGDAVKPFDIGVFAQQIFAVFVETGVLVNFVDDDHDRRRAAEGGDMFEPIFGFFLFAAI